MNTFIDSNSERLYSQVLQMMDDVMYENRFKNKILLTGQNRELFLRLARCKNIVNKILKSGFTDLYLIADQRPYGLLVQADTQFNLYPQQLKNEYEKKQVLMLTRNIDNIIGDDCDEHDEQQDFYTSNESQAVRTLVPDDNDLIKEKYSVYQLYDTEFLREILNAFFKMCKLSSQNKKLVNIGCYLTNSHEVTIEYKIDDSSLSIRDSIKRRRLKEIVECVGQQFPRHQFDELLMQIVEQMFLIEEVWNRKNKDIIYNLCYYSEAHEYIVGSQQFIPNRHQQWGIFLMYPINFNLFKLYGKYKILILRDGYQLYFLNHERIIMSQLIHIDDTLVSDYHQFIQCNIERLEKLRQTTINKVQSVEQQVSRDLNKFQQLGQEMEDDAFITHRIETYTTQMDELKKQIELIPTSQHIIDQQIEQNELQMQLQTLQQLQERQCQMRQEYNRVIKQIQHQLRTFKPSGSNHKDKQILTSAYNQMLVERIRCEQGLPIYAKKYEIMQLIKQNQVLLLIGETGSGKSTQLIQYIAEELLDGNRKVICSQPRALAARQLSKRVAEELKCRIGDLVGYSLSTEHKISTNTKIVFTQDRILLNKLNDDPLLLDYDAVIVDEAHERTVNTDLLVGLLKKLLTIRPNLKLIITSATLDQQLYCKYFNCPSFRVQGRQHQVQIKYCPHNENSYIDGVYSLVQHKIIRKIQKHTYKWMHVLVFLAGVDEINLMVNRFRSDYSIENVRFLGLHGSMSTEEQSEVFRESTQLIKVIFCTRIAETSITINDVTTVIDIGFDRIQTYDQSRGMQVTTLSMISQAQAEQRRGRAGRTRPGICYRLYSEHEYQAMESFKVPEIAKCNLDLVVLRIKSFKTKIQDFQFLDKPNSDALIQSEKYLVQINALRNAESDTVITPLGRLMSQIQTEPKLSRILIQGYYRGVFQDVLAIIAVMLNNQSLYLKIQDSQQVYNKLPLIDGSGDFMTFYQIYWGYKNLSNKLSNHLRKQWCIDNNLHYKTLKICESTYNDIEQSFRHFEKDLQVNNGIYNDLFKESIVYDEDTDKHDAILRCFLSSYYPDICVYNGNPYVGYTMVKNHQVLRIYGTCSLSVLNTFPKYIICADLYSSQFDYCKVAQEVSEDLVKSIVPPDFLEQIKSSSQINPRYDYAELHNLPLSLLFQLIKAYPNQYADNRFCQYAAADMHMQAFRLWSEQPINIQPQLDLYVDHCKQQSLTKVYGQRMIIFYTNGGSVDKIEFNIPLDYEIVEYTACPYNQYQLAEILKSEGLQYMYLFQHNITHHGYTGQIYFPNRKIAKISSEFLQQICQNNDSNNRYSINNYNRFLISGKSLKQRMVSACAELIIFSTLNKGVGQIYFNSEQDANKFFNAYFSIFKINNKLIHIMEGDQGALKITGVPSEFDEIRLERQVNSMCDEKQITRPQNCRLYPKDTYKPNQIDWYDMVKQLCDKYLNEWPVIQVYADKKDYKITESVQYLIQWLWKK